MVSNLNKQEALFSFQEAITLIERAELEERKLVSSSSPPESCLGGVEKKQPPPAPILLSRSHLSMTFTPAPYALEEEVVASSNFDINR